MRVFITSILILIANSICAQEFGTNWISYPEPDDSSEIWFRQTYRNYKRPQNAFISITSTGNIILYINQRKVYEDLEKKTEKINEVTINVSRFLNEDYNTIAVWYAPNPYINTDKQISLTYFGQETQSRKFFFKSNSKWRCKKARGFIGKDEYELWDNSEPELDWNTKEEGDLGWQYAINSSDKKIFSLERKDVFYNIGKITRTLKPEIIYKSVTKDTIIYDFGENFYGKVRLTIRNAKRGEQIKVGNYHYMCNGKFDEQAFPKFTHTRQRFVTVTGDSNFKISQIQSAEGLEITSFYHKNYLY